MSSFLGDRVVVMRGDITSLDVEMIVNAANGALSGGGGVDGAIHPAAGPHLLEECRRLGSARPGEVRLTAGHALKARFIAHAVAPVWSGGGNDEETILARCYVGALELAREQGAKTIAFPSISTGAYKFPLERAAAIALSSTSDFLRAAATPASVTFCCFSEADVIRYERIATRLFEASAAR
ncbi:MAG: macro domain-containing protein [Deltaproteobacteria bacterium]|nr:macro domain-containing protein [Deltaproteobacteria bacterium]